MRIIFCDCGYDPKVVDEIYEAEYQAAKQANFQTSLISFEALKGGDLSEAISRVRPNQEMQQACYRGWMLTPALYQQLYEGLLKRNLKLINSPAQYKHCHYLPESYELIKGNSPKTTFRKLKGKFHIEDFTNEIEAFNGGPIIVKDYVKSQKHYWEEACFIPNSADKAAATTVIEKFIELQGTDLNEGLVFREFVELDQLTNHSTSGMPLTKEFRLFIKDRKVLTSYDYWDEGDYEGLQPVLEPFMEVISKIQSNFFTVDVARKKDGEWIIVELGDGQVAGLPDNADREEFYQKLKETFIAK